MTYSYIGDFTDNTHSKVNDSDNKDKKSQIRQFIELKGSNFDKYRNYYKPTSIRQNEKEGGEWCSSDKDCKSKRCDTSGKYDCLNKCMNNSQAGSYGCFNTNVKNAGYNNYFVETEIECANYSGKKQNIYIDNDGFNRFYPKYSKSGSNQDFSTPALRMIAGIKNNHHDNSYDYKNWVSPHKKAKIYYYTNKNDIITVKTNPIKTKYLNFNKEQINFSNLISIL